MTSWLQVVIRSSSPLYSFEILVWESRWSSPSCDCLLVGHRLVLPHDPPSLNDLTQPSSTSSHRGLPQPSFMVPQPHRISINALLLRTLFFARNHLACRSTAGLPSSHLSTLSWVPFLITGINLCHYYTNPHAALSSSVYYIPPPTHTPGIY